MKFLRSTLGYCLAGVVINGFWGFFLNKFGLLGAYGAALFLTGSMWYINHYVGLIKHDEDSAFIDMGLGVAISLVAKNYIINGVNSIVNSIPTLVYVVIGAALGGYVAVLIEKNNRKTNCKEESFKIINIDFVD